MKLYTSIDFLPIYNYFQCAGGNYKFICRLENYDEEIKITKEMIDTFNIIDENFSNAIEDKGAVQIRLKALRILRLEKKKQMLNNYIFLLAIKQDNDIIELLKELRYTFDKSKPLEELQRLQGEVKNIENTIKDIESELQVNVEKAEDFNIYSLISSIEKMRTIAINPHTLSTSQFIVYFKELQSEMTKQKNK